MKIIKYFATVKSLFEFISHFFEYGHFNPLSVNFKKCSNTLKRIVSLFDILRDWRLKS